MGGDRTLKPRVTHSVKPKKRILFVCIGNACRSQMAEAFAKAYGSDILVVNSAGLAPAVSIPPLTRQVLSEKNISSTGQFPKGLTLMGEPYDVIVNLCGLPLPGALSSARLVDWSIRDPIGESEDVYRAVATQIEGLVMRLILELRG